MRSRPQPRAWLLNVVYMCAVLSLCAGSVVNGQAPQQPSSPSAGAAATPRGHVKSAAYVWLDIAHEATAREHERNSPRPTVGSRMYGIVVTSMYDAWAAYDEKAVGTQLGGKLRRPAAERTEANKRKAIAYATYRSLLYLFPEDEKWLTEQMRKYGFDPNDKSTDTRTPQGIGNVAAAAVIEFRRNDGANQHGDELGSNGKAYSDYTFYKPINPPDKIIDPDCWQPIPFDNGKGDGGKVTPGFLTPHWYRVKTFALQRSDQFRPGPPPKVGSEQLQKEVDEVLNMNGSLTLEQKAIVEFMRDGPRSTGQSGHWLRFAQAVSERDKYDVDRDVKLFFAVGNVAMDAFIAAWEAKRYYDSSRPWTLIHHYYADKDIRGWAGPGKGVAAMKGPEWHPYSPAVFITPPFPGYVSGHSTVSAASAKTLELFTGSDNFGATEVRHAGELTEPNISCDVKQASDGKPFTGMSSDGTVTLNLPTFTATAEMAGISRVLGGYHIQADNVAGLDLGRKVAEYVWPRTLAYFNGTAGKGGELTSAKCSPQGCTIPGHKHECTPAGCDVPGHKH